jgi:glycogen synthase
VHVLVTTDTLGGVWTYSRELVSELTARGVRVTLVSFGNIPLPEQIQWMHNLPGLDYRPTAFRLDWMQEGEQDTREAAIYLTELARELNPDLLHLNHLCHGGLPVRIPRVVVAHGDMISWWKTVHGREPKDSPWLRQFRGTSSRGLQQATTVVAPSNWMLKMTKEVYGWNGQGVVIPNGRNPLSFNPHVSKSDMVLAVGTMLDAGRQVALLTHHAHPIPVCIVGADSTVPTPSIPIRADVKLALEPICLTMKGPQTEAQMRLLYGRASVFAATSRYESFGMTTLEAALSRCAIVANDTPLHREIWDDAALYFQTNSADGLAEVIRDLNEDRELCRGYGNRAYQRARERFTARRMGNEYMGLYRDLIHSSVAAA